MAKTENPADLITDAEWQVAKVLWRSSPLTAAQIAGELKEGTGWSPKTVQTLIGRLVKKKIVAASGGPAPRSYRPLLSEEECQREKAGRFVDRIFGGSFGLLVERFVEDKKLTREEIDSLRKILDETEKR